MTKKKSEPKPTTAPVTEVTTEEVVPALPLEQQVNDFWGVKPMYGRTLRVEPSGELFVCSTEDWKKANCCRWWMREGRLFNQQGISFEDYVGIKTPRKAKVLEVMDFSRYNYE